jgi:hypothetical protein
MLSRELKQDIFSRLRSGHQANIINDAPDSLPAASIIELRHVCTDIADAAAGLVQVLKCGPACSITAKAWQSFYMADTLFIIAERGTTEADRQAIELVRQLLHRAPEARLRRLRLVGSTSVWAGALASACASQPSTKSLHELDMGQGLLTSDEVDALLVCLQQLKELHACLTHNLDGTSWAPVASASIKHLHLSGRLRTGGHLDALPTLDARGLACSKSLETLDLTDMVLANWAAIATLVGLQRVKLARVHPASSTSLLLGPLQQLRQLRELDLHYAITNDDWRRVAGIQSLKALKASSVVIANAAGSPSSSISSLICTGTLHISTPTRGCASRLLPELQELCSGYSRAAASNCCQLATAFAGHDAIKAFTYIEGAITSSDSARMYPWQAAGDAGAGGAADAGQLFSSMVGLESLVIQSSACRQPGRLLADAMACRKLRKLYLDWSPSGPVQAAVPASEAAIRELGLPAAAGGTLEEVTVQLGDMRVSLGWVMELLNKELFPALKTVKVWAAMSELRDLAPVQRRMSWLLGQLVLGLGRSRPVQVQVSSHDEVAGLVCVVDGIRAVLKLQRPTEVFDDDSESEDFDSDSDDE